MTIYSKWAMMILFVGGFLYSITTGHTAEEKKPLVGVIARYDDHGAGIPLQTALKLGVSAIQLKAPFPEHQTDTDAQKILKMVQEAGIKITSMQSGFTGESYKTIPIVKETVGLVPKTTRSERIEQFRRVCDFAKKLHLDTVCFHLGVVPPEDDADYREIVVMMRSLCDYAKKNGQQINLETGQETAVHLLTFIKDTDRDNLFINFDPANMIMYGCGDPIEALNILGKYVKSCHCKDALWSNQPGQEWGKEVPFGEGDVNAKRFITALQKQNYEGPYIVERENRNNPEQQKIEAKNAVLFIEKILSK